MPGFVRAAAVVVVLGLGACSRGDAPPCGAVAATFMKLAELDLERASTGSNVTVDDATRRAVVAQLPAMRDALATACTDSQWTAEVRRCLHAAEDHFAFEACHRGLTEPQLRALDRAARGEDDDEESR